MTRLSGQRFALNPDLMERIEATPDTVITLVDGSRHVVAEGVEEVVDLVRNFRASIIAIAHRLDLGPLPPTEPPTGGTAGPGLRLLSHPGHDG
ncbi:MAG TPA: flagellar FlbD family protein [Euzebya sp.]|nr:flagellar FlbD family protein [Euzebya sp.]